MPLEILTIDAFTGRPFAGNPAAVCLLDAPRPNGWMQAVARELNLSETAFLVPEEAVAGERVWNLRWFTPTVEVELCGHATLASAHFLFTEGYLAADEVANFATLSGPLTARFEVPEDGVAPRIVLDFPAVVARPAAAPEGLLAALGVTDDEVVEIAKSRFDYVVVVEEEDVVRRLRPDHRVLRALPVRGVSVSGPGDASGYHFVSRFFAPGSGIAEDPVTGAAHCTLGPYWAERFGRDQLHAFQASARGGEVDVTVVRAPGTAPEDRHRDTAERCLLGGQAVTVLRCQLLAEP